MSESIGCVILCKDEGYELGKCLKDNMVCEIFGSENVIVVSSSMGNILESEKLICRDFGVRLVEKMIGDTGVGGIGDLRNYGSYVLKRDWVLFVDVDELWSVRGMRELGNIVSLGEKMAYRFPRINLPWYEGWPDYQTRLIRVKECTWEGDVHELVRVVGDKKDIGALNEYPIIHKDRGRALKLEGNLRWSGIGKKNVLICSLFKDSSEWMDRFLECIEKIDKKEMGIEICFIEGNSDDDTWDKLVRWSKKVEVLGVRGLVIKMDINFDGLGRFDKLGVLRNMLIRIGLRGKHDYVLMVDSDCIFEKDLLVKLVKRLESSGSDVLGALVFIEGFRTFGNEYFYDTLAFTGLDGNKFVHYFPYSYWDGDIVSKGECFEVKSCGTCYLVRGEVYNLGDLGSFNVTKCYKEVSSGKKIVMYEGRKKSEQIRWCDSLRDAGYKVMVDSGVKVLHINLEKYGRKWH